MPARLGSGNRPTATVSHASMKVRSSDDPMPTRVLHLLPDFDVGGGQMVIMRTIDALRGPEWEHSVAAFGDGPLLELFRAEGITCEVVGDRTMRSWPGALVRLWRLLRRERIDVMHSPNTPIDRTMAQICGAASGRPVVVWFMSIAIPLIDFPPPAGRRLAFLKRLALYPFNYVSIRLVPGMAATSHAVAESFAEHLRLPQDRFVVIPPGVPDSAFAPALDHQAAVALRSELGIGDGRPVLLNVGMLIPLKGQLQLIEMMELLADDLPTARLLLVGDGPDRTALEARIATSPAGDRIRLLGHRHDVPDLMRVADALISASLSEGFGLTMLEAMGASLPTIGVRVPAFRDFVDEGVTSELVDEQDASQLAGAVRRVFSDPARASEMGERGYERALEFRASACVQALGALLRSASAPSAS